RMPWNYYRDSAALLIASAAEDRRQCADDGRRRTARLLRSAIQLRYGSAAVRFRSPLRQVSGGGGSSKRGDSGSAVVLPDRPARAFCQSFFAGSLSSFAGAAFRQLPGAIGLINSWLG